MLSPATADALRPLGQAKLPADPHDSNNPSRLWASISVHHVRDQRIVPSLAVHVDADTITTSDICIVSRHFANHTDLTNDILLLY